MITRRQFVQSSAALATAAYFDLFGGIDLASADPAARQLLDPALQPMFVNEVPNALDPGFIYRSPNKKYQIAMQQFQHDVGLVDPASGNALSTTVWGYGDGAGPTTWPGKTFEVRSGDTTKVTWLNKLPRSHQLPVDTSLHWAYSLHGYDHHTIESAGVPVVPHLHGGHTDWKFDGNPEQFFGKDFDVVGPRWQAEQFKYENSQPAGTLWYHDHALGVTRLNVYAGLAGFYIIRDKEDTGKHGNPLDLPAFPYEAAFAIQDRMFRQDGSLFYPAFPGDPFYADFITDEHAVLPPDLFPNGGPTALAEFFGDHMVVNGKAWPKMTVEPRSYRFRFLNGCDSRFLAAQFFEVPASATDFSKFNGPLPFTVIGSDQGLASRPTKVDTLLMETGSRYDVVFNFRRFKGSRVIMKNIGGDEPFGGAIPGVQAFGQTDRIMAFDVERPHDKSLPDASPGDISPALISRGPKHPKPTRVRKVALFEGKDEFGRLQPLLGTAEPATDFRGQPINWPDDQMHRDAGLVGPMEGSIGWHSPTTENPAKNSTEEWEIWNATGDAHPVHLHLVNFEILGRQQIKWDSNTTDDDLMIPNEHHREPAGDGTYLVTQTVLQHNGATGVGFKIVNKTYGDRVPQPPGYVENAPKDMVTALPGQITRIRTTFDKAGRYVWHCHILSHEDHEMMRVLHVGRGANE